MGESQDICCADGPEGLQGILAVVDAEFGIVIIDWITAYAFCDEEDEACQGTV